MPPAPTPKIIPHARAYRKQNSNIGYKSAPHTFAPAKGRNICRPHAASKAIRPHLRPQVYTRKKSRYLTVIPTSARLRPKIISAKGILGRTEAHTRTARFLPCSYAHMFTTQIVLFCGKRIVYHPSRADFRKKRGRHSRPLFILKNCHHRGDDTTRGNLPASLQRSGRLSIARSRNGGSLFRAGQMSFRGKSAEAVLPECLVDRYRHGVGKIERSCLCPHWYTYRVLVVGG